MVHASPISFHNGALALAIVPILLKTAKAYFMGKIVAA
jgi:hypothetical protein